MTELETRDVEFRVDNAEERTVTGLAVPYDQIADIAGQYQERFAPGAIDGIDGVKLFWNHEDIIGHVVEGRETSAGYEITAKVAATSLGNDVLELMRSGSVDPEKLSCWRNGLSLGGRFYQKH